MAIYHCSIRTLSRKKGRSSVQKSSYICCMRSADERSGKVFDYTNKQSELVFAETCLPKYAPDAWHDPRQLWNAVESAESKSNSKLAYDIVASLPHELTRDEQLAVCREQVDYLVSKGFCVTWAIHDKRDGNPHAHMLLTTRPLNNKGQFAVKETKEVCLDENGNRIPMIDPNTGLQKVRKRKRIANNGKEYYSEEKLWQTKKVSYNPLDDKNLYKDIRQHWADRCNERLPEEDHISPLSYKDQGIALTPSVTYTPAAVAIDARGGYSPIIEKHNEVELIRLSEKIRASIDKRMKKIRALCEKVQTRLDKIHAMLEAQKPKYPAYYPQFYIDALEFCKEEFERAKPFITNYFDLEKSVRNFDQQISSVNKNGQKARETYRQAEQKVETLSRKKANQAQLNDLYQQYAVLKPLADEAEKEYNRESDKKVFKNKKKERAALDAWVKHRDDARNVIWQMRKLIQPAHSDEEAVVLVERELAVNYDALIQQTQAVADAAHKEWEECNAKESELSDQRNEPQSQIWLADSYRQYMFKQECDSVIDSLAEELREPGTDRLMPLTRDTRERVVKTIARCELVLRKPLNEVLWLIKEAAKDIYRYEQEDLQRSQKEEQQKPQRSWGMRM